MSFRNYVQEFLSAVCGSTNTNKLDSWFEDAEKTISQPIPEELNAKYVASPPLTQQKYYDTPLNLALHTGSHLSVVSTIPSFLRLFYSAFTTRINLIIFYYCSTTDF